MAGFVAIFQKDNDFDVKKIDIQNLLCLTCQYKGLFVPKMTIRGNNCVASKIDTSSSLHKGIYYDDKSGSWILAAGTVVALEGNNDPELLLNELLRGLLNEGIKILDKYDGHFGLVVYNNHEKSLNIISDPLGLFAIYIAQNSNQILISTSALAIAQITQAKVDLFAVDCFLRTGRSMGDKTFWIDVKRIKPALWIKITSEKLEEGEYWQPLVDRKITRLNMKNALELADEKITRIINNSLIREGTVWADLTGGYDTRVLTMYLNKLGIPFIAYCVNPAGHPDMEISRMISKEMDWVFHPLELSEQWEDEQFNWINSALGNSDGFLNIFQLSGVLKLATDRAINSKISVPGTGIDEWRYHIFGANMLIGSAIKKINFDSILDAKIVENIPKDLFTKDNSKETRENIKEFLINITSKYESEPKITQIDIAFLRYRHPIHSGSYLSSLSGIIRTVIPFCFKELVNFGFSINHQWRIRYHSSFVSSLMEKHNYKLANIQTEKGGPFLPLRLSNSHKFIPLGIYLADHMLMKYSYKLVKKRLSIQKRKDYPSYPLPEWKIKWIRWAIDQEFLSSTKMVSGHLYNPIKLSELIDSGLNGKQTHSEILDRIVTIEMALRASNTNTFQLS